MVIRQLRHGSDNLSYIVHGEKDAIVIDGVAVKEIMKYLQANNLSLKYIFNTHSHGDHTSGNNSLIQQTHATFVSIDTLCAKQDWIIENVPMIIYKTPGHTQDSICFHINDWLITGDTLFNGTAGNCFTNDEAAFVNSLNQLKRLPDQTIIYPGHDYIKPAMNFARKKGLNVSAVDTFLASYDPQNVCSTLKQEKQHNPFLRLNMPEIKKQLDSQGLPCETETECFRSLKEIEIWD